MSCTKISTTEVPISVRWKIPKEKLLNESKKEEWQIKSEDYSIQGLPGFSYYIAIAQYKMPRKFGIYARIQTREEFNTDVSLKISIPSENLVFTNTGIKTRTKHVHFSFINDELFDPTRNFIVNDSMIITMEAIITVQMDEWQQLLFKIDSAVLVSEESQFCKLGLRLWDRDDKDFAFIVNGKDIQIHKLSVSTESSVFDRMIKSGLIESEENKVTIIDFDYETVEIALKFCYGIKDEKLYNVKTGINLLQFADKYDIKDLKVNLF
uniref:BTB domain-containing protein n=1 Tax=Panagrolaimus davidi TaxID=227884 RepID=A0A914Q627_9BILA